MTKLLLTSLAAATLAAADAHRGKLLLEDTFDGAALDPSWKAAKGAWSVAGGHARGAELPADKHAAVIRRKVAYTDAAIEVRFRLDGARQFALSINGANGHIARVMVRPDGFTLQKDRANARDTGKAEVLGKHAMTLAPGTWHTLEVQLQGKRITAKVAGSPAVSGEHAALDQPKADIGLPVAGEAVTFDSVNVWALTPAVSQTR